MGDLVFSLFNIVIFLLKVVLEVSPICLKTGLSPPPDVSDSLPDFVRIKALTEVVDHFFQLLQAGWLHPPDLLETDRPEPVVVGCKAR